MHHSENADNVTALLNQGQVEQAIEFCQKLCADNENNEGWLLLGHCHEKTGDINAAKQAYEKALTINDADPYAHVALGSLLLKSDHAPDAVKHFFTAIEISPNDPDIYLRIGNIYNFLSSHDDAAHMYVRAIKVDPNNATAYFNLGDVFSKQGKFDAAAQAFKVAQQLNPGDPTPPIRLLQILEHKKQYDEAWHGLKQLLSQSILHVDVVNMYAVLAPRFGETEQAIALAERFLQESPNISPESKRLLHSSLGNLYNKAGQFDEAFRHYHAMAGLATIKYDAARTEKDTNAILEVFAEGFQNRLPVAANNNEQMIFIVGMPRSGTSLTEQIIASHPQALGLGESLFIKQIFLNKVQEAGNDILTAFRKDNLSQQQVDSLAENFLSKVEQRYGDYRNYLRITEKTPFNFQMVGFISLLFPNARIIHIKRNPVDTCLSCYMQNFGDTHSFSFDLGALGHYYQQYMRYMDHWYRVSPLPILEVQYEELVADTEAETRGIIDFCGLDWDDACLNFHSSDRFVATASYNQVRKPIYSKSVERWRKYEKHLGPLLKALGPYAPQQ